MSQSDALSRRSFLATSALAGLAMIGADRLLRPGVLLAQPGRDEPPEIPNEQVARLMRDLFGDRPIRTGKVALDMPAVAEDGRVVPVIIESDLPMTPEQYVKTVHLIVDFNPDAHLAAFHLTPACGAVNIQTRIKMKRTTWTRCILETSTGELWASYARTAVTLNGCG